MTPIRSYLDLADLSTVANPNMCDLTTIIVPHLLNEGSAVHRKGRTN
jgi:hypothetical protein